MKRDFDPSLFKDMPLPPTKISELMRLVEEQLAAREADLESEKSSLKSAMADAEQQIAVLAKQLEAEEQGTQADREDLKRVTALFEKGALAMPRVTETRRAVLLLSSRQLETNAQLPNVKKQWNEVVRQIEKLDNQRKTELLRELQEASVRLTGIEAKLKATVVGLQNSSPPMAPGEAARRRRVTIFRKTEDGEKSFLASGDTELLPGDVVDVIVRGADAELAGVPLPEAVK